jgi:DNA-binding CsgD family transcriptional regulator
MSDPLAGANDGGTDADSGPERASEPAFWPEIKGLELPLLLVDFDGFTVSAATTAALERIGMPSLAAVGRPVVSLYSPEDRAGPLAALEAMRAGFIDFYRARRRLEPSGSGPRLATFWVRAVDLNERRFALAEVAPGEPARSPLASYLGQEPADMTVGTANQEWVINSVSADIGALLGTSAEGFVGRRFLDFVDPADVENLLEADRHAREGGSVALRVRMRRETGELKLLCFVLAPLTGVVDRYFMLFTDPAASTDETVDRSLQLERHLWRIAAEVEASGIFDRMTGLPNTPHLPQLGTLTARQLDVLSRLVRGERVPTIAKEMFLSQSTVRNHLAAIFQHFGVHSQAELLALLARGGGFSPPESKG